MQKIKAKIITALLLVAMALTIIPLANASLGNILINSVGPVQPLPIAPVPAGGNVSLYFGQVTFSGSQFYLLFSQDGLSQVTTGDIRYTTLFSVAAVMDLTAAPIVLADPNFPGQWIVGQGWVNGTIPLNIPGGSFYIKAFDGATTALAVSQAIPVIASLNIIPAAGSAGTAIIVSGNAFPTNARVNLSYVNPITLSIVRFANLTQSNALGQFNFTMPAPDLMQAPPAGDSAPVTNTITFTAIENATAATYTAIYTESQRGLLQLGRPRSGSGPSAIAGNLQNATGVFGNGTSFNLTPTIAGTTITVGVGDNFRIVGNSFYPGAVTMRWDNSIDLAPTANTANGTGYFNATFTVPGTGLGSHNITLIDAGLQVFAVYVNVVQSITISPTSGPIGTTVTVTGFGFPANGVPAGNAYNVTITFGTSATIRAASLTNANGQFNTSFVVPTAPGGPNNVTATANDTALTSAFRSFTVTANFSVSPSTFYANSSSAVVASGSGFNPENRYYVAIDNLFSPFSNTTNGVSPSSTGALSFTFIQAGFQPGLHVIAIYQVGGNNAPAANGTFTVLANPLSGDTALLTAINNTVVGINGSVATVRTDVGIIKTNVTSIAAQITGISNGFATVQTSVGTLTTTVQSLSATLSSVSGTVGTISTSVGSITTDLSAINTKVTSIQGSVATIQTDLGTLQGTVTSTDGKVATIQTSIGTLQADVSTLQTSVDSVPSQVTIPIWIAVVLALIAAIAAIASLLLVRRKIAG